MNDPELYEKSLRIPSSAILPLVIVGFFALGGLEDLADAAVITIKEGLLTVLSNPEVGPKVAFEVLWGSGQFVVATLSNLLFKNPVSKIRFE